MLRREVREWFRRKSRAIQNFSYIPSINPNMKNINGKKASTPTGTLFAALASKTAILVNIELCSPVFSAPHRICLKAAHSDSTDATLYSFHLIG